MNEAEENKAARDILRFAASQTHRALNEQAETISSMANELSALRPFVAQQIAEYKASLVSAVNHAQQRISEFSSEDDKREWRQVIVIATARLQMNDVELMSIIHPAPPKF